MFDLIHKGLVLQFHTAGLATIILYNSITRSGSVLVESTYKLLQATMKQMQLLKIITSFEKNVLATRYIGLNLSKFSGPFLDCTEVQRAGYITSGTFNLKVPGYEKKIRVWCDLEQVGIFLHIEDKNKLCKCEDFSFFSQTQNIKQG